MASRGVNKVIIVGNLGQDPEVRFFPSGGSVCNITVATSETWKDKQTGEQKELTEWHKVVFSNKLAEIAAEYLKKGAKVYIEGRLQTRKWQNQEGNDQYSTEIRANEMQMLDSRGANQQSGGQQSQSKPAPQNSGQQQGGYQQNQAPASPQGGYQQNQAPAQNQHQGHKAPSGYGANKPGQDNTYQNQQAHSQNQNQAPAPHQGGYQQQNQQQSPVNQQQAPKVNPQEPTMDFDDDIPF